MKIIHSKSFTLIEVLVASIVVSIIMLGIITSSLSLNNNARYAAGSFYVTQDIQNILNDIHNNAFQAYGTADNPGFVGINSIEDIDSGGHAILSQDGSGDPISPADLPSGDDSNTFCVHQNLRTDGSFNETFPDANHRWLCYTLINYNLYSCVKVFDAVNLPNTQNYVLNVASSQPGACSNVDINYKLLGALKVKPVIGLEFNAQSLGQQKALFTVTLETCLNPGDPNCGSVATRSSNPYATKTATTSLPGHRIN